MIDLKKLGRIGLDSSDQQKVDTVLNVDHSPLISPYNKKFIEYGFVEVKNDQYYIKMSKREKELLKAFVMKKQDLLTRLLVNYYQMIQN